MERIIKKHNNRIINYHAHNKHRNEDRKRQCNCRTPTMCPMGGRCQIKGVVYQASVTSIEKPSTTKVYIGCTKTDFKTRFTNHKHSFSNTKLRNATTLSRCVWDLKDKKLTPVIRWDILKKANVCRSLNDPCFLCLNEKLAIVRFPDRRNLLNNRFESSGYCKHKIGLSLKYN